jgi:hypothetical protein
VKAPKKGRPAPKLHFKACKSPKAYSHLKQAKYEFAVRGINSAGADTHTATKSFKIA